MACSGMNLLQRLAGMVRKETPPSGEINGSPLEEDDLGNGGGEGFPYGPEGPRGWEDLRWPAMARRRRCKLQGRGA
jgi:hypothetical protein